MPDEYNVVVVGSGVAGLTAALTAAELGLSAVVLEKGARLGGGSAHSYGLVWVGGNAVARAARHPDSRAAVLDYLRFLSSGYHTDVRLQTFVDRAPEAVSFLCSAGVELRVVGGLADHYHGVAPGSTAEGRTLETGLVRTADLGEWGDRIVRPPVGEVALTAEEMIAWGGVTGLDPARAQLLRERHAEGLAGLGVGLVAALVREVVRREVPLRVRARVDHLLVEDGRTCGVETVDGDRVRARRGVVLAAGGYDSDPDRALDFEALPGWISLFGDGVHGENAVSLTADAMVMAAERGAAVRRIPHNLQVLLGFQVPFGDVPGAWSFRQAAIAELCSPHTVVVNRRGRRFANEAHFQYLAPALREFDVVARGPANLPCFLIFDRQYTDRFSFAGAPVGEPLPYWVAHGESLTDLAGQLGIDAAGLEDSVASFNEHAARGEDPQFGRGTERWRLSRAADDARTGRLGTIAEPPFHGIELRPTAGSSAGLDVDEHGRVRHVRGHAMPGLYATGNSAVHTEFGTGYQHGLTLASGITFSYLAVRHMAGPT